jgi:hypothetical protein
MLFAHLVPGYFAAAASESKWDPEWTAKQRVLLWAVALGSTFAPDLDVIHHLLTRGTFYHSTLWTHSLFVYLGIGSLWLTLRFAGRWPYLRTLIGLATIGGLSHLILDVIAHGTPLFYPLSIMWVGAAPAHILQGGVLAYLTDLRFLLEPLLLSAAAVHWLLGRKTMINRLW